MMTVSVPQLRAGLRIWRSFISQRVASLTFDTERRFHHRMSNQHCGVGINDSCWFIKTHGFTLNTNPEHVFVFLLHTVEICIFTGRNPEIQKWFWCRLLSLDLCPFLTALSFDLKGGGHCLVTVHGAENNQACGSNFSQTSFHIICSSLVQSQKRLSGCCESCSPRGPQSDPSWGADRALPAWSHFSVGCHSPTHAEAAKDVFHYFKWPKRW